MQQEVKICPVCNGKGINPKTNAPCENCRGIGGLGYDGQNEYYLATDEKGNLRIADVKTTGGIPDTKKQRKTVLRGLFLVITIILYIGFLGFYFTLINDKKVFWTVTIILLGIVILYFLYDTNLTNFILNFLIKKIMKEPDDFKSAVKKRSKETIS